MIIKVGGLEPPGPIGVYAYGHTDRHDEPLHWPVCLGPYCPLAVPAGLTGILFLTPT